jgi:LacI family transcriptional regulator
VNASPDEFLPRRPSLKAVAARAGVAVATASYALNNHPKISEATRRRVRQAAEDLGYRTNARVSRLMAELRSDRGDGSTLAWVNCSPARDTYLKIPWMRGWLAGARARADRLGYTLEEFWIRERGMSAARLIEVLFARGTSGIILAPTWATQGIAPMDLRGFPAVSMAETFNDPILHQAATNTFANVIIALEEMAKLGYRKIGFFASPMARGWTERQHVGAFLEWMADQPKRFRTLPLLYNEYAPDAPQHFQQWVRENEFEAILSTNSRHAGWIAEMGLRVPEDIGLAHLNLAEDVPDWAGIDPLITEVAAAAVDLLVGQIHRHEAGSPPVPKITTIIGVWVPGGTLKNSLR